MLPERVESLRPSGLGVRLRGPCLAWGMGLVLLVGLSACGSPAPETPGVGQAPTPTSPLGATGQPVSAAARRPPDAAGAPSPAPVPADTPPSNAQPTAEQAQREAREQWFAELRESPDATVRLQALEQWAQQPGDTINPLTYALVDEDEAVRARAEALYAQQRAREETETAL